jgi:formate dehydrogenase beta subunit
MATIIINGKTISAADGTSVLEAALRNGIYIPHLCHHPDLPELGACRLCVVECEGEKNPVPACTLSVRDGLKISTESARVNHLRKLAMELILAAHPADCSTCPKYGRCELQTLIQYMAVSATRVRPRNKSLPEREQTLLLHDMNRCVLCGRCVRACRDLRGVEVLQYDKNSDMEVYVGTLHDKLLRDADCRFCGTCAEVCPTGAIRDIRNFTAVEKRDTLIPCQAACPAHIDIPRYVRLVAQGREPEADAVIREKVPFPGVLGNVCNHRCEAECRRGTVNEPVSICKLKRHAADADKEAAWKNRRVFKPKTGKTVAVVGGGPTGLTAAYYLAKQGYQVTVFESKEKAGGHMQFGIPSYRLPKDLVQQEVSDILEAGVEIRYNSPVTNPAALTKAFDAVILAIGVSEGTALRIPGADAKEVYTAVQVMAAVNRGEPLRIGRHPFVIGGGSVGFDTARTLLRMGAETVTLACLESREQMKATPDEIQEGVDEGVQVFLAKNFLWIAQEGGDGAIDEVLASTETPSARIGRVEGFSGLKRQEETLQPARRVTAALDNADCAGKLAGIAAGNPAGIAAGICAACKLTGRSRRCWCCRKHMPTPRPLSQKRRSRWGSRWKFRWTTWWMRGNIKMKCPRC